MKADYTYQRPHRALAIRLADLVGGLWRRLGLPLGSLDEESLLDSARRRTGLSDFGSHDFREALHALLEGLVKDAHLHPFGRMLARQAVIEALCNRLRVQEQLREHPEILESPVRRPLVIVSLPRTGTTFLQNLLAQDPASRPLLFWEAAYPAPLGPARPGRLDPRMRRSALGVWWLKWMAPNLIPTISPIHAEEPEECHPLLRNTFVYTYALAIRTYREWFRSQPEATFERAYEDYRCQLQLLQWQRPAPGHWLLKSSVHLWSVGALLRALPDASVIQTHRDPCKAVPSFCSLAATVTGMFSHGIRLKEMGPVVVELLAEAVQRAERVRDAAGPDRFFDLNFARLVADPMGVVREIYDKFGYELTPEFESRAREHLANRSPRTRKKHRYTLQQFGVDRATVSGTFERYCRQHGIGPE